MLQSSNLLEQPHQAELGSESSAALDNWAADGISSTAV